MLECQQFLPSEFGQSERPPLGIEKLDLGHARSQDLDYRAHLSRHEPILALVSEQGHHVQQLHRCVLHTRSIARNRLPNGESPRPGARSSHSSIAPRSARVLVQFTSMFMGLGSAPNRFTPARLGRILNTLKWMAAPERRAQAAAPSQPEISTSMNWFNYWRERTALPVGSVQNCEETMNNFTPRAQQVLALARKEADRFNHNFVGTEHLLLGLIKLGQGVAVNVLLKLGLDLETVRLEVEKQVGTGPDQKLVGNIPHTPRVKKVLALAQKEAEALNHTYVGTEHILLGLLSEGDGVAARVLKDLDVDMEQTRQEILKELDPNFNPPSAGSPPQPGSPKPEQDVVDASKRYDVYCSERNQEIVVYRDALFKGGRRLFQTDPHHVLSEFLELEQADGQTIFIARSSILKFREHVLTPGSDSNPSKQT